MTLKGNGTGLLLTHRKYNLPIYVYGLMLAFKTSTQLIQININNLLKEHTEISAMVYVLFLWIINALAFLVLYRSFPNNYWDKFVKRKASRILFRVMIYGF